MKSVFREVVVAALTDPIFNCTAQTVRDNSAETYFRSKVLALCGSNAHVSVSSHSASIYLDGEYLENRNLDEIAWNLALSGLDSYPKSNYFTVWIEDSKGRGHATVNR